MDRQIVWSGQIPLDVDQLRQTLNAYTALGRVIEAVLGASTLLNGFACTPTGPASMQVLVGAGEIYSLQNVDATSFGSITSDTTHQIMKQGVLAATATLSCPAPGTSGFSINYLVQIAFSEVDGGDTVLPFYNADNPTLAWSGPGNTGDASKTVRQDKALVSVKAGTAATTGSQITPSPDAGYVGAYVVTVANGATTIISGNIAVLAGAPFITERLTDKIGLTTGDARYATVPSVQTHAATYSTAGGTANALTASLTPVPGALAAGLSVSVKATATNSGATTINLNSLGVKNILLNGAALTGGEIVSGSIYDLMYDGTQFQLLSPSAKALPTATTGVAGVVALATNAEARAGANTTKALTPDDLFSFAQSIGATSGYYTIPGAGPAGGVLIRQYGYYAGGSAHPAISFPVTFPTAVLALNITSGSSSNATPASTPGGVNTADWDTGAPPTTSGFTAWCRTDDGSPDTDQPSSTVPFFWIADGH